MSMELQHGEQVSLGMPVMSIDARENKSVPAWIEESILPAARDDRKPFLDIYAQLLHVNTLLLELREINAVQSEVLARILEHVRTPWYQRAWIWLKGRF